MKFKPLDFPMIFSMFIFGWICTIVLSSMNKDLSWVPMFLGGSFGIILIMYRYGWDKDKTIHNKVV